MQNRGITLRGRDKETLQLTATVNDSNNKTSKEILRSILTKICYDSLADLSQASNQQLEKQNHPPV